MEIILEYLAFGSSLVASWLYGNKGYGGPIAGLFTSTTFIAFGFVTEIYAAGFANIIFFMIHLRNLRKVWIMDENRKKTKITGLFNYLQKECHKASYESGWWHDPITKERILPKDTWMSTPIKIALIHSEISEALEADRTGAMDDKLPHRLGIECELADAVIRIADLAEALNLDVGGAITEKMQFNLIRPDHKLENRRKPGGKKY